MREEQGVYRDSKTFDVIVEGGDVIDGTGTPRYRADVGTRGARVAVIGELSHKQAHRRVDAHGKVVSPGFIDAHTHDDRALLSQPDMTPKASQGVTTVITGNCGVSLAPLVCENPPPPLNLLGGEEWYRFNSVDDYVTTLRDAPAALNSAMLVGHSTLRTATMEDLSRPATRREIEHMGELLDEGLGAGCIGLSLGLDYPTASAAPTSEVTTLARHLPAHGGICTVHMRSEEEQVLEAIEETLEVGRDADVPMVISHFKVAARKNWGRTKQTLARVAAAQQQQRVDFDVYPYVASSTVLMSTFAESSERVLVAWSEPHPELAGKELEDIRSCWGCTTEQAIDRLSPAGGIYYQMDEDDLQRVLRFPKAMIGSDGLPHDVFPHPRLWGSFPRVLGYYARELGLFSMEEAVHRMTGVTASVFKLRDRGVLREGAFADLVVFDPETVIDTADFEMPKRCARGIDTVMVNGAPVWHQGEATRARPGRFLAASSHG